MPGITNFNRVCNGTECFLSMVSAIPVIGTPVAACKFTLGTIQTITALALGIISLPFRFCSDDARAFNDHCWSHVIHGLGNMAASVVEAIPFLSLLLFTIRLDGIKESGNDPEHQFKYIPYTDVVKGDIQYAERRFAYSLGSYRDALYANTSDPAFLSPTHFRQATGFNAIIVPA